MNNLSKEELNQLRTSHQIDVELLYHVKTHKEADEDGEYTVLDAVPQEAIELEVGKLVADFYEVPDDVASRAVFFEDYVKVVVNGDKVHSEEDSVPINFNPETNTITERVDTDHIQTIDLSVFLNANFPVLIQDAPLWQDFLKEELSGDVDVEAVEVLVNEFGAPYFGKKNKIDEVITSVLETYGRQLEPWQVSYKIQQVLKEQSVFSMSDDLLEKIAKDLKRVNNKDVEILKQDVIANIEEHQFEVCADLVKATINKEVTLKNNQALGITPEKLYQPPKRTYGS